MSLDTLDVLRSAGWFPEERFISPGETCFEVKSVLLAGSPTTQQQTQRWLAEKQARGGCLTVGFPGERNAEVARWVGDRLIWWPRGIPGQSLVAIVSSRLLQRQQILERWTKAFRSACDRLDRTTELLVGAQKTPTWPFVLRAARLWEVPLLEFHEPQPDASLVAWWRKLLRQEEPTPGEHYSAYISPRIQPSGESTAEMDSLPLRDRCLVSVADRVMACHVRRSGHLAQLLRMACRTIPKRIEIVPSDELVAEALVQELETAGCQLTAVEPNLSKFAQASARAMPVPGSALPAVPVRTSRIESVIPHESRDFLTHCTRAPRAAWPDQTDEDYFDELLLGSRHPTRTAFDALARIVQQQQLCSGSATIRGQTPVVCFTERHPLELIELRIFRPHRSRWDFEPYGICIRRRWLQQRGAEPVVYGDESFWEQLPARRQPFFQLRTSSTRSGAGEIDWSIEREWRQVGDVEFAAAGPRDVVLFVPAIPEAESLAALSRWPVAVLGDGNCSPDSS